jgi:hypothetical protein
MEDLLPAVGLANCSPRSGISDRYIQGRLKEPLPNGKSQFVTSRVERGRRKVGKFA